MSLSQSEKAEFAEILFDAYANKEPIEPLSDDTEFTTEEAYEIQAQVLEKMTEGDNAIAGHKLGLVSEGKQEQLGIPEPIFGYVTEENVLDDRTIPTEDMIAPRLEAEVGFILGEDVSAPASPTDIMMATDAVVPVVEILESRFKGWTIPTPQDVIADNTSTGHVFIGETMRAPTDVDLKTEGVVVTVDGETQSTGVGADVMGHPARSVAWLVNRLEDLDEGLEAGELVMSGGVSAALDIEPGDVYNVEFADIGAIELNAE